MERRILVCRWVSLLLTENWNRQAQTGSCTPRSCRTLGRAQGHSECGWGCTGQKPSLDVVKERTAGSGKDRWLKLEARKGGWGQSSFLLEGTRNWNLGKE